MAIVWSQTKSGNISSGGATASITPAAGSILLLSVVDITASGRTITATASVGGALTSLMSFTSGSGTTACLYLVNTTTAARTVTITATSGDTLLYNLTEYTNVSSAAQIDGHTGQYQASPGTGAGAITSGTYTPGTSGDVVVGLGWNQSTTAVITAASGTSRSAAAVASTLYYNNEDQAYSSGTTASTFTQAANNNASVVSLALKPASTNPAQVLPGPAPDPRKLLALGALFVANNLLTTTLDTAEPFPVGTPSGESAFQVMQQHGPGIRNYVNADTTHSTPQTLTNDPNRPVGKTVLHNAPIEFRRQVVDTTQDTPKTLFVDAATEGPGQEDYCIAQPQRFPHLISDTTAGSPAALTSVAVVIPPTVPPVHLAPIRYWYQPVDTSQSTAKALYGDAATEGPGQEDYCIAQPARFPHLGADTSHGFTPLDPVGKQQTASAVPLTGYVANTTAGTPQVLTALVSPPIVPAPHLAPLRAWWQPADSSQSVPKVVFADATIPFENYQHTAPDRLRPVTDTSQQTPAPLTQLVAAPFVPPPHFGPQRFWFQPSDTSQSLAKSIFADSTTPFENYQHSAPDRIRPVADTSQSSPGTLTQLVAPPTVPPPHLPPLRFFWQPADTSQSISKPAYSDSTVPLFNPPPTLLDGTRPVTDTSQSSPLALLAPSIHVFAGHIGGDDAPRKRRRVEDFKPEKFGDLERRMRLRAALEAQFEAPQIKEALKPYTKMPKRPNAPIKFNWAQVYEHIDEMERTIAAMRRDIDDEDDILSIM